MAFAKRDDDAIGYLKRAIERFAGLGLPLETARSRLELARALAPSGPQAAVYEARLALVGFERLGAAHDLDAVSELLRTLARLWTSVARAAGR